MNWTQSCPYDFSRRNDRILRQLLLLLSDKLRPLTHSTRSHGTDSQQVPDDDDDVLAGSLAGWPDHPSDVVAAAGWQDAMDLDWAEWWSRLSAVNYIL